MRDARKSIFWSIRTSQFLSSRHVQSKKMHLTDEPCSSTSLEIGLLTKKLSQLIVVT